MTSTFSPSCILSLPQSFNSKISDLDTNKSTMQNDQQQHEAEGEKVKEYADIIKFKLDGKGYPDSQGARVGPNQRLKTAFGIDNTFTHPDKTAKNVFSANTVKLIRDAIKLDKENRTGDWSDMRTYTMNCCKEYLQSASNSGCLNLSELVQFVTLKVSLYYLFPGEASNTDDTFKDMVYIGHRINELWIASKTTEAGRPRWADEKDLHDALRRVTTRIPSNSPSDTSLAAHAAPHQTGQYAVTSVLGYIWGCVEWIKDWLLGRTTEREDNILTNDTHATPDPEIPSRNPMNLILPAYETMWRAVMRCFLEIRYLDARNGPEWSRIMEEYLKDLEGPDDKEPKHIRKPSPAGIQPMDIVKEALRLYPPTRRVHRNFNGQICAADIEKCQRFELPAGVDPLLFSPERWQDMRLRVAKLNPNKEDDSKRRLKDEEQSLGFMPFVFHCPSSRGQTLGFGFKMIGLLVATLCAGIDEKWELKGDCGLPMRDELLSSDRQAYEDLWLEKS
jgi:hypothetical protein